MRHFTSITQLGDLSKALEAAKYVKENPFADQALGRNKTLLLRIYFYKLNQNIIIIHVYSQAKIT